MYAETDFLLALIKDEDWLGDAAETVYREHRDELWTSQFTGCRGECPGVVRKSEISAITRIEDSRTT